MQFSKKYYSVYQKSEEEILWPETNYVCGKNAHRNLVEKPKQKRRFGDRNVDRRIILKSPQNIECIEEDCVYLAQGRDK